MRRALHVLVIFLLLLASVSAQAIGLTPVAIMLLVVALLVVAPLVNPATP